MPVVVCLGNAVRDLVFSMPRLPQGAGKHRATGLCPAYGGPAANAATAIARLGARARLIARVGDDAVGAAIIAELGAAGVDASAVRRFAGCDSSVSAVVVDEAGERMIVNYLDANLPMDAGWIPLPQRGECDAALADTRWPAGASALLSAAKALGVPAVLDADTPVPRDGALLRSATHVAFSAPGLASYAGEGEPRATLARVAADLNAWCCVTLGEAGVAIADGTGGVLSVAAFRVHAVDTLGAGDVWHGTFAWALASGTSAHRAVRLANAAAAIKVQGRGLKASPTGAELEGFVAEHDAVEARA